MVHTKPLIIITISLVLCLSYAKKGNANEDWDQFFSETIDSWITEIAMHNTRYTDWIGANWNSLSFGPNSKQWLITVCQDHITIGHLVVGEDESGKLFIIDYGLGEVNQ